MKKSVEAVKAELLFAAYVYLNASAKEDVKLYAQVLDDISTLTDIQRDNLIKLFDSIINDAAKGIVYYNHEGNGQ